MIRDELDGISWLIVDRFVNLENQLGQCIKVVSITRDKAFKYFATKRTIFWPIKCHFPNRAVHNLYLSGSDERLLLAHTDIAVTGSRHDTFDTRALWITSGKRLRVSDKLDLHSAFGQQCPRGSKPSR